MVLLLRPARFSEQGSPHDAPRRSLITGDKLEAPVLRGARREPGRRVSATAQNRGMGRSCLMRSRVQRSSPRAVRGKFRIYSKTMHTFVQTLPIWREHLLPACDWIDCDVHPASPSRVSLDGVWILRPEVSAESGNNRRWMGVLHCDTCCGNRVSVVQFDVKIDSGRLLARGGRRPRAKQE